MLAKYMNIDELTGQFTTFKKGIHGANGFFKELASIFTIDAAQLEEIRKRVSESAKQAGKTASEELRKAATDRAEGAKVFGGYGMTYDRLLESRNQYDS